MKQLYLLFFTCILLMTCSKKEESNQTDETNEVTVIRYETQAIEESISIKSTYINFDTNQQLNTFYRNDEFGDIQRLTHIVSDDGSGISTIFSFDDNGFLNTIYEQNGLTGEIINKIYITHINGITYYGNENETLTITQNTPIDSFGSFLNSDDDLLLSQALNQNKSTLEQLLFAANNNNRSEAGINNGVLILVGAAILIGTAIALNAWFAQEAGNSILCQIDNTCGQGRSTEQNNNSCSILSNEYVCSALESVVSERDDTSNLFVTLCGDQICIVENFINLTGNWNLLQVGDFTANQYISTQTCEDSGDTVYSGFTYYGPPAIFTQSTLSCSIGFSQIYNYCSNNECASPGFCFDNPNQVSLSGTYVLNQDNTFTYSTSNGNGQIYVVSENMIRIGSMIGTLVYVRQ